MSETDPNRVVATFDSASVLHASLMAALQGRPFPHLGNSDLAAAAIRVGTRLPWPVVRTIYTRIGGSEGIRPDHLHRVDVEGVARQFADDAPDRRYPAVLIGSSNGALVHLAAALQIPWLPGTLLVPVKHRGDPQRPDDALGFGRRWAPALLDANPGVNLHQMHDPVQDALMTSLMTYFRIKWNSLPSGYQQFLEHRLVPGAPILLAEDTSTWPVRRVAERHVFQTGGRGGVKPEELLHRAHVPDADDMAPEAEWGADPGLGAALHRWSEKNGHPLVRLRYNGPQEAAHPVAATMRNWYRERDERHDQLLVPSFILGDPWSTINTAMVAFWTYFSVQEALQSFDEHLARSDGYRRAHVLMFQHGVRSEGIAMPSDWREVGRRHGVEVIMTALREQDAPHDIGAMARYARALAALPTARRPWGPLPVGQAVDQLRSHGLQTA